MPTADTFSAAELEVLNACPWCSCDRASMLFAENGFPYVQCDSCSLIYLRTRVREEHLDRVYSADYHSTVNVRYAKRCAEKLVELLPPLRPNARIHEDGAGAGAFVAACQSHGFVTSGNDLAAGSVQTARSLFGVDLHYGALESVGIPDGSLDILASFNLLSHLYRPWEYLRHAQRLLAPDGLLLIRTGDRTGWRRQIRWGQWSAPEHVFHYTRKVLETMMNQSGLRLIKALPAFDSEFPYFLYEYSRNSGSNVLRQLAARICSLSSLGWTLLRLPKEDYFFLVRPSR